MIQLSLGSIGYPIFLQFHWYFQPASGINAILYYLMTFSLLQVFNKLSSDLQAWPVRHQPYIHDAGHVGFDRIGRSTLWLIGSVGTAACLACVRPSFLLVVTQSFGVDFLIVHSVLPCFPKARSFGCSS